MAQLLFVDVFGDHFHPLDGFVGLNRENLAFLVVVEDVTADANHAGDIVGAGVAACQGRARIAQCLIEFQEVVALAEDACVQISTGKAPINTGAEVAEA